jgi:hypothetical protein
MPNRDIRRLGFPLLLISVGLPATARAQPQPTASFGAPRLLLSPAVGPARGAGNTFVDFALTAGLQLRHVELRARTGTLVFSGACDLIVPTKCGDGDGRYYDATLALRLPDALPAVGAWTISAGAGLVATGSRAYITGVAGRDIGFGRRGVLRVELHVRHLYDSYYRQTWGESHNQLGLRVGAGFWTALCGR